MIKCRQIPISSVFCFVFVFVFFARNQFICFNPADGKRTFLFIYLFFNNISKSLSQTCPRIWRRRHRVRQTFFLFFSPFLASSSSSFSFGSSGFFFFLFFCFFLFFFLFFWLLLLLLPLLLLRNSQISALHLTYPHQYLWVHSRCGIQSAALDHILVIQSPSLATLPYIKPAAISYYPQWPKWHLKWDTSLSPYFPLQPLIWETSEPRQQAGSRFCLRPCLPQCIRVFLNVPSFLHQNLSSSLSSSSQRAASRLAFIWQQNVLHKINTSQMLIWFSVMDRKLMIFHLIIESHTNILCTRLLQMLIFLFYIIVNSVSGSFWPLLRQKTTKTLTWPPGSYIRQFSPSWHLMH